MALFKFFPIFCLISWLNFASAQISGQIFYYGNCKGAFEANPSDCTTYFQCNFGYKILQRCPPSLEWNPEITACDWPSSGRVGACTGSLAPQEAPEPNDLGYEPEGQIHPAKPISPLESCTDGSLTQNPKDCSSFYICNHGVQQLQQCGSGLQWNSAISSCDWPAASNCGTSQSSGGSKPPPPPPEPPVTQPVINTPPAPVVAVHPVAPKPTPWTSGLKLVCYFTDWAWYRPLPSGKYMPADIDPSLCTHIVYAFALLNENDFILKPADTWADFDNGFYQNLTSLKSRGIKVTIALGGWNDSGGSKYSQLVNDPTNRAKFVTAAIAYIKKYNFDGLDLDWEYPTCWQGGCKEGVGDKAGFASLVKELRAALPEGYILSAAVSASKVIVDAGYDVPTLSKYLDWIGVMDYDFHGHWDKQTGHIAPLYYMEGDAIPYFNVNSSISYWIECGADPKKLVLGIPLYGQSFTLASSSNHALGAPTYGPGAAGDFTRQGGVLAYYEICSKKWNVVQDSKGRMGPYGYNGDQWVAYDDVPMVIKKANFAKAHGLGGGMIWALDMDDFTNLCGQGRYPLLSAIANTLKK